MADWPADQLKAIAENDDLFVSPFREDGVTHGTPTQTWALVVGGNVYVRAALAPSREGDIVSPCGAVSYQLPNRLLAAGLSQSRAAPSVRRHR
jgi:Uncharacterized protein conserved in bacteria (DUF2255)